MMVELKEVKKAVNPTEVLLVVDAMTGQEAAGMQLFHLLFKSLFLLLKANAICSYSRNATNNHNFFNGSQILLYDKFLQRDMFYLLYLYELKKYYCLIELQQPLTILLWDAALVTTFNIEIGITGAILTKLDGDSRGGAALSVKEVLICQKTFLPSYLQMLLPLLYFCFEVTLHLCWSELQIPIVHMLLSSIDNLLQISALAFSLLCCIYIKKNLVFIIWLPTWMYIRSTLNRL